MTTARKYEALIAATADELATVAAIVGDRNVKRLVMADNGIPPSTTKAPPSWNSTPPSCRKPNNPGSNRGTNWTKIRRTKLSATQPGVPNGSSSRQGWTPGT